MWEAIVFALLAVIILLVIIRVSSAFENQESDGSIPKIIHQTAPADKSKWNAIWEKCQDSWKKNFSDYQYKMWTDEDLDNLIKTKYSWFYPTYIGYPKNINRIDAARYFILFDEGGIYADMDFECIKNFEHLLPKGKACAAESPWAEDREKYQNALMASPAGHEFWKKVWVDLEGNKTNPDVLLATGPEVIHRMADANPDLFHSLPRKNFAQQYDEKFQALGYIKHNLDANIKQVNDSAPPDLYARHHGTGSWF